MKLSALLAVCAVLIGTQAGSAEILTKDVTAFIRSTYTYADYTLPTYDRDKAVALIQDYLKENKVNLSDFDKVRLTTKLGDFFTGNAKPGTRDVDKALPHFRRAVVTANGRLSFDALRAALSLPNLLDDRRKRLTGETEHFLFRRYLNERSDDELLTMLLKPIGTSDEVAKESKQQLVHIRNMCKSDTGFQNIQSMAKNWYSREVTTVNDAYWLLLTLKEDKDSQIANKAIDSDKK